MSNRNHWKLQAIKDRGGFDFYSPIKCDLCGKIKAGLQMHERIKRSQTISGSEARELSFQPELCNLLCAECHAQADTKEIDYKLWLFSCQLYGILEVIIAFDKLNEVLRRPIESESLSEITNESSL